MEVLEVKELYKEKNKYLHSLYGEVKSMQMYREIFPIGSFERAGHQEDKKANGILRDLSGDKPHTYIVTDELDAIAQLQGCSMAVMSCCSFSGHTNKAVNARWLYAIIIDVDYLTEMTHIKNMVSQIENNVIPRPTYTVNSGTGVHLYYVFDSPIPMYPQVQVEVRELKYQLIERIWNRYTSAKGEREDKQRQGIMQNFRIVGSQSKLGADYPVRAYRTGSKISIEYLNGFVEEKYRITDYVYKSELSLEEAAKKYPDWYERRIIKGENKGFWIVKRDLYDWWLRKIREGATVGHRYYCVMCLAIYALKCGISYEELEKDAYSLLEPFNALSDKRTNPFTKIDIEDALHLYNEPYKTYPRKEVERVSGIRIDSNKRNYRKQADHIKLMNYVREEINGNKNWRNTNGRPSAAQIVNDWKQKNPTGRKVDCIKDTGLSKPTVYKWW